MKGGTENEIDLEVLRKMNDQELRRFRLAARFMCSARAKVGKPPRLVFVIHFEEARAEVERRNAEKERPTQWNRDYVDPTVRNFSQMPRKFPLLFGS
jgi:hypothetical protein